MIKYKKRLTRYMVTAAIHALTQTTFSSDDRSSVSFEAPRVYIERSHGKFY